MIALRKNKMFPIGLHLQPRSATLVQLVGRSNSFEVHEMARGELPFDEEAPPEDQDREVVSGLQKLIADHDFKGRRVTSCLGSQELFVHNVRLPQLPDEEVDKVVRWEAEERLPYPVAEAEIRHLLAGQVHQDETTKQEVILLACRQTAIERHVSILEQAGLIPVAVDAEPCAVLRCLNAGRADQANPARRAYLNLGQRATTVIFADGDQVVFLKYIASGGEHLDLAVSRHLDLNVAEAARMRAVVTSSQSLDAEDEIHCSVIDAIRGPLEDIGSEIELCLRYYKVTFRGKPLDKIIVTGNEASPWLLEFLADRLATPCEIGDPFEVLGGAAHTSIERDRPWKWTTAVGLSMK